MKTRYKILILNLILTTLYYFIFRLYVYNFIEGLDAMSAALSIFYLGAMVIVNYNWIHLLWLVLLFIGIFKKKKELIYGGILSIILSGLILVAYMLFYQN